MTVLGNPDVALTIGPSTDTELVLAYRDGDETVELASADCGRLELYRGVFLDA